MAPDDPTAYFLPLEDGLLTAESPWAPETSTEERAIGLAGALTASPAWRDLPDAVMLVRPHRPAAIVIAGRFDAAAAARLEGLPEQIGQVLARTRYRDHRQVEEDCAALSDRLLERVGPSVRSSFRVAGIPRGGQVVAGLLSYCLDVPADRCGGTAGDGEPLLVVDDCALTGARFRAWLEGTEAEEVVFAPLWAAPPLREAIEEAEPRVAACVSGRDLREVGRDLPAEEYRAWRRRWAERSVETDLGYWWGLTEHVCFPWNEPDVRVWNEASGRVERGWRVVPPERCLENRVASDARRVSVQPRAVGPLRPADDVVFGADGDGVLLARRGADACWRLEGTAAAIWSAMVESGSREAIVAALSERYEADEAALDDDVEAFLGELASRGVVTDEPRGPHGGAAP